MDRLWSVEDSKKVLSK